MGDLLLIFASAAGGALLVAVPGALVLRRLRHQSITLHVCVLVAIAVLAVLPGVVGVAQAMFIEPHDVRILLVVVAVSGAVSLGTSWWLGRRLAVEAMWAREARERERQVETGRRELVAWVSHDLRTPLAGLRAMAEALEDQVVVDPREVNQYHSQIRREVDRLTVMIDDLFELSRIHAGALRLTKRMVGLEDLVAEVVASTDPVARAKGVRLTGAAVRGMPVYVDAAEMGRALRNLVTNAIRHTPSDGGVEVLAEVQSGMACVSVSDACGGIPPGDLTRVFDVAFRGESARTPGPQSGGGLGLSIARGIVEAHSGQIAVRNAGRGCQFLIRLPLARGGVPALNRTVPRRRVGAHTGPIPGIHTGPMAATPGGPAHHAGPAPAGPASIGQAPT